MSWVSYECRCLQGVLGISWVFGVSPVCLGVSDECLMGLPRVSYGCLGSSGCHVSWVSCGRLECLRGVLGVLWVSSVSSGCFGCLRGVLSVLGILFASKVTSVRYARMLKSGGMRVAECGYPECGSPSGRMIATPLPPPTTLALGRRARPRCGASKTAGQGSG